MLLGIDHLVIADGDPDQAVEELAHRLGLRPGGGGTHPALGTRNRLLWLGDTYIELLGIEDPAAAGRSWLGAPALEALERGEGLLTWAIASDDLDRDAAKAAAGLASLSGPIAGERRRPDGEVVRWRLARPPVVGLDSPFLIEHDAASAEWTVRDRAARAADPGRLRSIRLPVAQPERSAERLAGVGLPVSKADDRAVLVGDQRVELVSVERVARPVVGLEGMDPAASSFELFGIDWTIATGAGAPWGMREGPGGS
jgi:hypothetical protein